VKVSFGVSLGAVLLQREDAQQFMDLVKMAGDYGVEALGTYDSAFIGGDTYVRTTLMAMASQRARVGPRPTNPLTREPQVMASYLASIDSLTNGRAFMDIASGDSAVFNVQTYVDGYELYDHVLSAGRNPKRMEELGLTDYAVSRWALAGNPSDWVKRIEEVATAGATKLWVGIGRGNFDRQKHYMRIFGEQILPHCA